MNWTRLFALFRSNSWTIWYFELIVQDIPEHIAKALLSSYPGILSIRNKLDIIRKLAVWELVNSKGDIMLIPETISNLESFLMQYGTDLRVWFDGYRGDEIVEFNQVSFNRYEVKLKAGATALVDGNYLVWVEFSG